MVAALVLGAGCTGKGPSRAAVAASATGGPVTFVVLGDDRANASQTRDALHQAWPQLVFNRSLPRRAVYVDLAGDGARAGDARRTQVPAAVDLKPTVVAVWLGHADEDAGTSAEQFQSELGSLVDELRRSSPGGRTNGTATTQPRVLLLAADPYVDAVRNTARDHHAEVVDVHGANVDTSDGRPQQTVADDVSKALGKIS